MSLSPEQTGDRLAPAGMRDMLSLDPAGNIWTESDKADLLRHQLSTPLLAELRRSGAIDNATLSDIERTLAATRLETFRDIFSHPAPSADLLRAVKDFGKFAAQQSGPLPAEIGYILCYAAIAVALSFHGQRITTMDNPSIRQGIKWGLQQTWLDQQIRNILEQGIAAL